jgi:hypothetical protein
MKSTSSTNSSPSSRTRRLYALIILVPSLLTSILLSAHQAKADAVTPHQAYEFTNSTGVNTHFAFGTSKYRTQYQKAKSFLEELGVRHIRDGIGNNSTLATFKNLWQTLGIRLTGTLDQRTGGGPSLRLAPEQIAGKLRDLKMKLGAEAVQAIEGPNEYNRMERDYNYMNWPGELQEYQTRLVQLVNADPDLRGKEVIAPSIGGPDVWLYYSRLRGNFVADKANAHIYPNRLPFAEKTSEIFPLVKASAPGREITVTETGYHAAHNAGAQHVTEAVRAKYLARATVAYATDPDIDRGFIYQLIDLDPDPNSSSKGTKGLVNFQLQPKLSFYAVRNMMHILCDNSTQIDGRNLNYNLSGNLRDVRTVLYQKTNHAYYLLIWLEKVGMEKYGPVNNPAQSVQLDFGQNINLVRSYRPSQATGDITTGNRPRQTFDGPNSLDLNIYDDITILEIVPNGLTPPPLPNGCHHRPA